MTGLLLLKISLRSLGQHKGRSFLTMLGIIIGISAIIATLAIGRGAEEKTRQRFLAMGNNYVEIFAGNWMQEGKTIGTKRRKAPHFQYKDVPIVKRLCPYIKHLSPTVDAREVVSHKGNNLLVSIKGGNEHFLKILDRKIKRGTFFNPSHIKRNARVVVLGHKSAKELFCSLDPIGQKVYIKNIPFTVIGVVKKMDNYRGVRDPNFDIFAPYKTVKKDIHKSGHPWIRSIIMSAPNKDDIPKLVRRLRQLMRFQRKIKEGETENFTIVDQATIMKAAQGAAGTIRLLLLIIASISLLVGGIGIMNIMLVSVTERTREIGIRMALGAYSSLILRQFLNEALTLCFIGGGIGTLLGISIPYAIANLTKWDPIVTPWSIIVAFLTTTAIGIFFGFYPAYKAAHLNPVDALVEH